MTVKFHWSNFVKIITALTLLLALIIPCILGVSVYIDTKDFWLALVVALSVGLVTSFIIGACAYWAYGKMPVTMSIDSREIVVKQGRGNSIVIPLESVVSMESIEPKEVKYAIRTFGSGGLFGFTGQFWNKKFGHFEMYATEYKNLIMIKTVKKTYVFSCRESDAFISYLRNRLPNF